MRPPGYGHGRQARSDDYGLRELAHELRPAGHGALVLLGFLAYVSFSSRFAGLSDVQRAMAICGLAAAGLAVAAAVRLASRMLEPGLAADLLGGGTAAFSLALWFVVPRLLSSGPPAARPPGDP